MEGDPKIGVPGTTLIIILECPEYGGVLIGYKLQVS